MKEKAFWLKHERMQTVYNTMKLTAQNMIILSVDFMKHNEQTPCNEFEVIKQAIAAGYTVLEKIKKDEVALEPNA